MQVFLLAAAIFVALLWLGWRVLYGQGRTVVTEVPERLKKASIWGKERSVKTSSSVYMHGIIDEGFRLPDGTIVLSDTKSRDRRVVHESDILQLSAYKLAIEESTGERVSDDGYVRLLRPDKNEYIPVKLFDRERVVAAYNLYHDLVKGKFSGAKCESKGLCRTCAYRGPCDDMG